MLDFRTQSKGKNHEISQAGTDSRSGYSFGSKQTDVGQKGNEKYLKEMTKFLENQKNFTEDEKKIIKENLGKRKNKKLFEVKGLKQKINNTLSKSEGTQMIERWDNEQRSRLSSKLNKYMDMVTKNPNVKKDEESWKYVNSLEFKAQLTDHLNQYPEYPGLQEKLKKGKKFTFEDFANYEGNFYYVKNRDKGAEVIRGRRDTLLKELEFNNKISKKDADKKHETIKKTYLKEGKKTKFVESEKSITGNSYTVSSGDTLGQIAQKAGASLDEIMVLNPEIKDANKINLGQEIKLPKKEKTEEKEEKNNIEQNTNKDNENDEKVIQKEEEKDEKNDKNEDEINKENIENKAEEKVEKKDEVITDKEENTEKKEEEKEEKKEQSKVAKEVIDEAKKADDPIDEIVRKPVENWTEKEADEVGEKSMQKE